MSASGGSPSPGGEGPLPRGDRRSRGGDAEAVRRMRPFTHWRLESTPSQSSVKTTGSRGFNLRSVPPGIPMESPAWIR